MFMGLHRTGGVITFKTRLSKADAYRLIILNIMLKCPELAEESDISVEYHPIHAITAVLAVHNSNAKNHW